MASQSSQWNNNTAFLLAATGSAVGLGNIWGFPYKAGENGGGLFVLLYIFFVITLGLPVFMAEVFIGKKGKSNPVTSIETLAKSSKLANAILASALAEVWNKLVEPSVISSESPLSSDKASLVAT